MLQNAYLLAKIAADTAENERYLAKNVASKNVAPKTSPALPQVFCAGKLSPAVAGRYATAEASASLPALPSEGRRYCQMEQIVYSLKI